MFLRAIFVAPVCGFYTDDPNSQRVLQPALPECQIAQDLVNVALAKCAQRSTAVNTVNVKVARNLGEPERSLTIDEENFLPCLIKDLARWNAADILGVDPLYVLLRVPKSDFFAVKSRNLGDSERSLRTNLENFIPCNKKELGRLKGYEAIRVDPSNVGIVIKRSDSKIKVVGISNGF